MGKTISTISVILVICSLILGIATRESFVESNIKNTDEFVLKNVTINNENESKDKKSEDYESEGSVDYQGAVEFELELLEQIDFAAKVSFTGKRIQMYESTLSEVEVLEVYLGDESLEGNVVDIFETNYFSSNGEYMNLCPTNLMQKDKEYYVFLMSCDYSPEYQKKLTKKRFYDYLVYSSVVPVGGAKDEVIIANSSDLKYGDVKDYDFLFFKEERRVESREANEAVLKYFGLNK